MLAKQWNWRNASSKTLRFVQLITPFKIFERLFYY